MVKKSSTSIAQLYLGQAEVKLAYNFSHVAVPMTQ